MARVLPRIGLYSLKAAVLSSIALGMPSHAAADAIFEAHIVDMPFGTVLDVLGGDFNIQFTGERSNRRRITDLRLSGTPSEVIDVVMRSARMDSFTFNGQVYFSPIEDRAVRLVPLADNITATQARDALAAAGLIIPGYDVTEVSNGGALVMSGPVRYLALCEGVINAIAITPDVAETPVLVRRGGTLVAEDTTVSSVASTSTN